MLKKVVCPHRKMNALDQMRHDGSHVRQLRMFEMTRIKSIRGDKTIKELEEYAKSEFSDMLPFNARYHLTDLVYD